MEKLIKLSQNIDALMDVFQVKAISHSHHLENLLTVQPVPLKESYQEIFDMLLSEIQDKGDQWNESQRRTVRIKNEVFGISLFYFRNGRERQNSSILRTSSFYGYSRA